MKKTLSNPAVCLLLPFSCGLSLMQAETLLFDFDDGSLQGWTANVPEGSGGDDFIASRTSGDDGNSYDGRALAFSGDYMILEADYLNRDGGDTTVKILTSPELSLSPSSSIFAQTLGGRGAVDLPVWTNYDQLPTSASGNDFMGLALRRVSDGEYLLFSRRSGNGQSNRSINWLEVGWEASEIAAAIEEDSPNETYQVDLIDAFTGGWGWIGMDEVRIVGELAEKQAPIKIPSVSLDPESETVSLTWNSEASGSYTLSKSQDLSEESWVEVDDAITAAQDGEITYEVSVSPDTSVQFYRVSKNQ